MKQGAVVEIKINSIKSVFKLCYFDQWEFTGIEVFVITMAEINKIAIMGDGEIRRIEWI